MKSLKATEVEGSKLEKVINSHSSSGVKRRYKDDAADRISELPESLIIQILSLLDMKDAVKTGILSKRWKLLWTNVDCITYHHDLESPSFQQVEEFIAFVHRTLPQCTCSKIKKFSVTWSFDRSADLVYDSLEELDEWLEFVGMKNVEFVHIGLKGLLYDFPNRFYDNSSFVELEINNITGSLYSFHLTSLKTLSLKSIRIDSDNFIENTLLGCPVLETIVLDDIKDMKRINITSKSVKKLKVLNFQYDEYDFEDELEHHVRRSDLILKITAPFIQELEILGKFEGVEYQLLDVSLLKKANIVFWYSMLDESSSTYSMLCPENHNYYLAIEEFFYANPDVLWLDMVDGILNPVSHVEELVIGSELIHALSLLELLDRPPTKFVCKQLSIYTLMYIHEIPGILHLLRNSPNLETLVINMSPFDSHFPSFFGESFSFKKVQQLNQQDMSLVHLKNVTIDFTKYLNGGNGNDRQKKNFIIYHIELLKHMFQNSPVCEKLVKMPSESDYMCSDADDDYDDENEIIILEEEDEKYCRHVGRKAGRFLFGKSSAH